MGKRQGVRCEIAYAKGRNKVVYVTEALRRSDSLAQAALIVGDELGNTDVIGVLHEGRWLH